MAEDKKEAKESKGDASSKRIVAVQYTRSTNSFEKVYEDGSVKREKAPDDDE